MKLLPNMQPLIDKSHHQGRAEQKVTITPINTGFYSENTTLVDNETGIRELIDLAYQVPLTGISIDFKYGYNTEAIPLRNDKIKYDIRSIKPWSLSITLMITEAKDLKLCSFVVNLSQQNLFQQLAPIFKLPTTYIAHDAKPNIFCLRSIGIEEPSRWWDTMIAERAIYLGLTKFNSNYAFDSLDEEIQANEQSKLDTELHYSLAKSAERYQVAHQDCVGLEAQINQYYDGKIQTVSDTLLKYMAQGSVILAKVYLPQRHQVAIQDLSHHLVTIEMPWINTNAEMEWNGVLIDPIKRQNVSTTSKQKLANLTAELLENGLTNPNSNADKEALFQQLGILHHFRKGSSFSFKLQLIKDLSHIHPVIKLLAEHGKIKSIQQDIILWPSIEGADGRVHAEFKQLETVTGRQSGAKPNLLGLPSVIRPLIVAPTGYGIGEVDLSQIEIAITAAVYGDHDLVAKFNQGDIYAAMAMDFFEDLLNDEDRKLTLEEFKISIEISAIS